MSQAAPQVTVISVVFTLSLGVIDHETELRPGEKELKPANLSVHSDVVQIEGWKKLNSTFGYFEQ